MDANLYTKIDALIEEKEEELVSKVIQLIQIDSTEGEPLPGAPFGKGPREMLDTVLEMGKTDGFAATDYGVGVVSVAMKEGQPDLGIWAHGDVVPAGDGWNFPPYQGTRYKDCIIGRGATDNKGQLVSAFLVLKILKELGVELKYNPALYVGSNEESGMKDMKGVPGNPDAKGFVNVCTPPRLSLVPDGSFPIGYGAKGMTRFYFKSKTPLHGMTLTAGLQDAPGLATAELEDEQIPDALPDCQVMKGKTTKVTAFSEPCHPSRPNPDGNMITMLTSALLGSGVVHEDDKNILEFFHDISLDIHGSMFGIDVESELMGGTIVSTRTITCDDNYPELEIRLVYPIELTHDEMLKRLTQVCEERGFVLKENPGYHPYLRPSDTEVVTTLKEIANAVTGEEKEPYVNGVTYAHYLPNAYIYGMQGNRPPEDFPKGRGGAHGMDEVVSIERLKTAMKIYARALLALNEIEW